MIETLAGIRDIILKPRWLSSLGKRRHPVAVKKVRVVR
jgi:hypothetical protein